MIKQLRRSIAVMLLVTWQTAENCPWDTFMKPDGSCCRFCLDGYYITTNCSQTTEGYHSTGCKTCSICPKGWMTVAQCTKFSDTVCEKVSPKTTPIFTAYSTANPDANSTISSATKDANKEGINSSVDLHIVLYITLPLVLFLIIIMFACKKCVINRYAQTKQAPYKLQQL